MEYLHNYEKCMIESDGCLCEMCEPGDSCTEEVRFASGVEIICIHEDGYKETGHCKHFTCDMMCRYCDPSCPQFSKE